MFVFVVFFLEGILVNRLTKELDKTFDKYYSLKYESLNTSIDWNGLTISFNRPSFVCDTSRHDLNEKFPTLFFKSDKLEIKNISIRKILFTDQLALQEIRLKKPHLKLIIFDSTSISKKQKASKKGRKIINFLAIKKINIENGTLACSQFNDLSDTTFIGININSKVENIKINVNNLKRLAYNLSPKNNFSFSISKAFYVPHKSNYFFKMDSLVLDDKRKIISAKNISEKTLKSKIEISRLFEYTKIISDVEIGSFLVQGYDLKQLVLQKTIVLHSIHLDRVELDLFKNKKRKLDKDRERLLIQEMLTSLPFFLKIDTLKITNSNLNFEIVDYKTKSPVIIYLSEMNLILSNVNTFTGSRDTMILLGNGKIMDRALFNMKLVFPNVFAAEHYYNGSVGHMSFQKFNPIMSSYSGIQFVDGTIESIIFSGKCNRYENNGSLVFRYKNLEIKSEKLSRKGKKKTAKLTSYLGNMILENNNPRKKGEAPQRYAYYLKREKHQSHIALLFNGVLEGVKNTLVDKKTQERVTKFNLWKARRKGK